MKFKMQQLKKSFSEFFYSLPEDSVIDVCLSEEDIQRGTLGSSMLITVVYTQPASRYESNQSEKTIKKSIEIFPESENRPPRIIKEESQELIN